MICSICKRQMNKEREGEGMPLCYVCFMVFNSAKKRALNIRFKKSSHRA
jgi:uncharacterized CHY-type Zn-finger protein